MTNQLLIRVTAPSTLPTHCTTHPGGGGWLAAVRETPSQPQVLQMEVYPMESESRNHPSVGQAETSSPCGCVCVCGGTVPRGQTHLALCHESQEGLSLTTAAVGCACVRGSLR